MQSPSLYQQYFPDGFVLETNLVKMQLMQPSDLDAFLSISKDPAIWTWFTRNLSEAGAMEDWVEEALQDRITEKRMPFTIIDKQAGRICGSTSYGNISWFDKRIEIGWTWLGTPFMGTGINRQAKFALLSHAFDVLKMERVEVKTDVLNERARRALQAIGMQEEGVLRNHMQMFNNRRRDTIYYSIVKEEWPTVRQRYFRNLLQ